MGGCLLLGAMYESRVRACVRTFSCLFTRARPQHFYDRHYATPTHHTRYKIHTLQAFFEDKLPGALTFPDVPDATSVYVAISTWLCGSITTYSSLNSGVCVCMSYRVYTGWMEG